MEKRKITEKELAERRKNAHDAEILASLDNNAEYSSAFLEIEKQYLNGEINIKEYRNKVLKLWPTKNIFFSTLKKPTVNKF